MSFQDDDLGGDDLLEDNPNEEVEKDVERAAEEQKEKEDEQSLPLASGADDSRNDISDVGLFILANDERLVKNPQPLSSSSRAPATRRINQPSLLDPNERQFATVASRFTGSDASESLNNDIAAAVADDDDGFFVPKQGLFAASNLGMPATMPIMASAPAKPTAMLYSQNQKQRSFKPTAHLAASATQRFFGAPVPAPAVIASPASSTHHSMSGDASEAENEAKSERLSVSKSSRVSASKSKSSKSRSRASASASEKSVSRSVEKQQQQQHKKNKKKKKTLLQKEQEDEEETYADFQRRIERNVRQEENNEKNMMLLMFWEKRQDGEIVPDHFFERGVNSDLHEMRYWFYKLQRDTRIKDAVANAKSTIVQAVRGGLMVNNMIGNPLNLRLDNDFTKELQHTLNTKAERHLRDHIKSKCGISGPKTAPWTHIAREMWECGYNYHQNKLAVEASEERQRKEQMAAAAAAAANYQQQQQQQTHQQAQQQQTQRQGQQTYGPASFAQSRFAPTAPIAPQQPILPQFQPDKKPLNDVFRNMTSEMRSAPIPSTLAPPALQKEAIADQEKIATVAERLRQRIAQQDLKTRQQQQQIHQQEQMLLSKQKEVAAAATAASTTEKKTPQIPVLMRQQVPPSTFRPAQLPKIPSLPIASRNGSLLPPVQRQPQPPKAPFIARRANLTSSLLQQQPKQQQPVHKPMFTDLTVVPETNNNGQGETKKEEASHPLVVELERLKQQREQEMQVASSKVPIAEADNQTLESLLGTLEAHYERDQDTDALAPDEASHPLIMPSVTAHDKLSELMSSIDDFAREKPATRTRARGRPMVTDVTQVLEQAKKQQRAGRVQRTRIVDDDDEDAIEPGQRMQQLEDQMNASTAATAAVGDNNTTTTSGTESTTPVTPAPLVAPSTPTRAPSQNQQVIARQGRNKSGGKKLTFATPTPQL